MDLFSLSFKELQQLQKTLPSAIRKAELREKAEAKRKLEAYASEMGFDLDDLLSSAQGKKGPKGIPKYRDPADPSRTWSGRGRRPEWFSQALERGMSSEELLI